MSFQFNFFGFENSESEKVEHVRENVPELVKHEILEKPQIGHGIFTP